MSASDSWRLSVEELDRSSTIRGDAGSVGAMVVRASKGNTKPTYIAKGKEQRILDLFGSPSSAYPDVLEAIEFNKQDALWVSAPYDAAARLGGVEVSDAGTTVLSVGIDPATYEHTFGAITDHFVITSISPYADDLGVLVTRNVTSGYWTIKLYRKNVSGANVLISTNEVSLTIGEKDGFGAFMYIDDVFTDNDYIKVIVNPLSAVTTFVDDTTVTTFAGGLRGSAITTTEIAAGWAYFQQSNAYKADIFMDTICDSATPGTFDTLRSTYQKYSSYIIMMPSSATAAETITAKDGYSINNRGLAFYWNHAKVKDVFSGQTFWTTLMGRVGAKYAQMVDTFNGGAPAWIDENGHGGQLGSGVVEMAYDPTEGDLQLLDEAGINPIATYPGYGVMITSQRTGQSPGSLSDTSWIAHSRLFDYIISNLLKGVLVYQIVKLNDELHRRMAVAKGETLIDPILAKSLLTDYAIQCDLNNNDDAARAARQFVYTVFVKVTPYSEAIKLQFVSVGQSVEISSLIS